MITWLLGLDRLVKEQLDDSEKLSSLGGVSRPNNINFVCPECQVHLKFRKRVTMTPRRCPQCNSMITVTEIDKQIAEQEALSRKISRNALKLGCGCLIVLLLFVLSFVFLALVMGK